MDEKYEETHHDACLECLLRHGMRQGTAQTGERKKEAMNAEQLARSQAVIQAREKIKCASRTCIIVQFNMEDMILESIPEQRSLRRGAWVT